MRAPPDHLMRYLIIGLCVMHNCVIGVRVVEGCAAHRRAGAEGPMKNPFQFGREIAPADWDGG